MQICVTVLCWVLLCKFVMCKFVLQLGATLFTTLYFWLIGFVLDSPGRHHPIRAAAARGDSQEQGHGHGVQEDNICLNLHKLIMTLY